MLLCIPNYFPIQPEAGKIAGDKRIFVSVQNYLPGRLPLLKRSVDVGTKAVVSPSVVTELLTVYIYFMRSCALRSNARSTYHAQLAKTKFDEVLAVFKAGHFV